MQVLDEFKANAPNRGELESISTVDVAARFFPFMRPRRSFQRLGVGLRAWSRGVERFGGLSFFGRTASYDGVGYSEGILFEGVQMMFRRAGWFGLATRRNLFSPRLLFSPIFRRDMFHGNFFPALCVFFYR